MTFPEIYNRVKDFEGWMGKDDCRALYDYASQIKKGLIVELGSYGGISTVVLALSSPTSRVVTVDPYIGFEDIYERFRERTGGLNITLIKKTSNAAIRGWKEKIDFLHVDGDHSYKAVRNDIKNWLPYLKRGHFALFHDYSAASIPGVKKAVDESKYKVGICSGFAVLKK